MNMRGLNFPYQPNTNTETTLGHQHWINATLSTLFCQRWNNVDKHSSAQLSFSIKFQRWNNVGSSTLNRRNSIRIVSTLFLQRWNKVDKCTSAQLSFSTKYQRWATLMNVNDQGCFNVDLFAGKHLNSYSFIIGSKNLFSEPFQQLKQIGSKDLT